MNFKPSTPNGWWPRFSPDGRYVCYGTGEIFVTDMENPSVTFIARNGCYAPRWIRPDTVTYTRCLTPATMKRLEVKVGEWVEHEMPDDVNLVVANDFDAQDGHWMSTVAGVRSVIDGVVADTGRVFGAHIAGPYALNVHADNNFARLFDVATRAHIRDIPLATPTHMHDLYKDGTVAYGYPIFRVARPTGEDIDVTASPTGEGSFKLFDVNGALWCASSTTLGSATRVFLRPVQNPATEEVIEVVWPAVYVEAKQMGDNIRLALSGDRGQMEVLEVPINTQRRRVLPSYAPSTRALWAGYFYSFGKYGSFPDAPGNCSVVVDAEGLSAAAEHAPVIIGANLLEQAKLLWNRVAAVYIGGEGTIADNVKEAATVTAKMAELGVARRPIVAYFTSGMLDTLQQTTDLGNIDWVGIEAYFPHATDSWTFYRWWHDRLDRLPLHKKYAVIAQAFDRNHTWTNEKELSTLQGQIQDIADNDRCVAMLWFAYARPGGAKDYPRVLEWNAAFARAVKTPAIVDAQSPVQAPQITIASFETPVTVGHPAHVVAQLSGDQRSVSSGSITLRARGLQQWTIPQRTWTIISCSKRPEITRLPRKSSDPEDTIRRV
jgi:hypothetical protein